MIRADIIADSVNPAGDRLTTWELTYPRFVHAELMTHRVFSRNAASSRAIPVHKLIEKVEDAPAAPVHWGANQRGMQARREVDGIMAAQEWWYRGAKQAVELAKEGAELGLHKQIVNRVLEPYAWITTIVSATTFTNWFRLRAHRDAQPEIQELAYLMKEEYETHDPQELEVGEWHLPYTRADERFDLEPSTLRKVSTARCARVSYLTHDGQRDLGRDVELHNSLKTDGHWSPFEHPAMALPTSAQIGNFRGWLQYRKWFPQESGV